MHQISGYVSVTSNDGVLAICIDRPEKKNAVTHSMWVDLVEALKSATPDQYGAVVLKGQGSAFCTGNDVKDFLADPPKDGNGPVFQFLRALLDVEIPIVAGVRGLAVGIGATMLFHCDLVYASPTATLKFPFLDLGLVPEGGSSRILPRRLGRALAGKAIYLGEGLGAQAALEAGLVTEIVPDDQLDQVVARVASTIAAKPRQALVAAKKLLCADKADMLSVIEREGSVFRERLASPECRQRLDAFVNRR